MCEGCSKQKKKNKKEWIAMPGPTYLVHSLARLFVNFVKIIASLTDLYRNDY